MHTKGNKMIVGNLAEIRRPYRNCHSSTNIRPQYGVAELAIDIPDFEGQNQLHSQQAEMSRAAVTTTEDIMGQHPEVFPEVIPDGFTHH